MLKETKVEGKVETIAVKEVEKLEIKGKECGAVEKVVKGMEKIDINEEKKTTEVKEEVKHIDTKDKTHSLMVEIKEDAHHESHEDNISPLDSGDGSEHNKVKEQILGVELKGVDANSVVGFGYVT